MTANRRRDRIAAALSLALLRPHRPEPGTHRPLFIIGSGRSGNTLVRRVLMASRSIYIPPETYVLGEIIEVWQRSALLPWRERVWLFCAYFEKHNEFSTFGLENLTPFAHEAAALPPHARSLRQLIDAFYAYLARKSGSDAHRWGDKTPYNIHFLSAITRLFPDAQFLWLVRDGRDVALSYVKAGLYPDLTTALERWHKANAACLALSQGATDVRRQSYEDLVSDPERQFRDLFAWADLPFDPTMLEAETGPLGDVEARAHHTEVRNAISNASVGRWRAHPNAEDLAALPEHVWEMMETLGYTRS